MSRIRPPDQIVSAIEDGSGGSFLHMTTVGGGCIANAARVETSVGPFFLKYSSGRAGDTFEAEAAGLEALRTAASPLLIPQVFAARNRSRSSAGFLMMEWVNEGRADQEFFVSFGRGLAEMHRHQVSEYGFETGNFIGQLPQENAWSASWREFYVERRLNPQVAMARDHGRWSPGWNRPYERLLLDLTDSLPDRPEASILHGDLWSGNYLTSSSGHAVLIDPATYFGHREADLALTELFGGFDASFYASYREEWDLDEVYEVRRDVYNLYHLLNHLNHFGSSYAPGVARILARFG